MHFPLSLALLHATTPTSARGLSPLLGHDWILPLQVEAFSRSAVMIAAGRYK